MEHHPYCDCKICMIKFRESQETAACERKLVELGRKIVDLYESGLTSTEKIMQKLMLDEQVEDCYNDLLKIRKDYVEKRASYMEEGKTTQEVI